MLADVSIRIRDLARSDERARLWKAVEDCGHLKIAKGNCNSQIKALPTANRFAQMWATPRSAVSFVHTLWSGTPLCLDCVAMRRLVPCSCFILCEEEHWTQLSTRMKLSGLSAHRMPEDNLECRVLSWESLASFLWRWRDPWAVTGKSPERLSCIPIKRLSGHLTCTHGDSYRRMAWASWPGRGQKLQMSRISLCLQEWEAVPNTTSAKTKIPGSVIMSLWSPQTGLSPCKGWCSVVFGRVSHGPCHSLQGMR